MSERQAAVDGSAERALAYISGLEMILVDVSNLLIRANPDRTESVINDAITRVGRYCDVDRTYVFRVHGDGQTLSNTQEWCAPGIEPQIDDLQAVPAEAAPRMMERLRAGEPVHIARLADLDESWLAERQLLEPQQIQSLVVVPILFADGLQGFIGFDSVARTRDWRDEEIRILKVLGDLVGGAIERSRNEVELRQWATVFESTAEGVFITDLEGNVIDVNPAFTEITGFEPQEVRGRNPRMWQSGRHSQDFFQAMWAAIGETGRWRGEIWNRRRDGSVYPAWLTISAVRDLAGRSTHYVSVFSDITNVKNAEERLDHLAHHDPLTDLPNRLLFHDRLAHGLTRAQRVGSYLAILYVDLDRFKDINDSLGHAVGDELLRSVAARLARHVRRDDTVARLGGDEFVLLLESVARDEHAAEVSQKILRAFQKPFRVGEDDLYVGASIGISLFPRDGTDSETLMRNADAALYRAKERGRNDFAFYTEQMTQEAAERMRLTYRLRHALEEKAFRLHYQPQVDMRDGSITGMEALLRWHDRELGEVAPDRFIPLAEEIGLILPIGRWVLETACRQAASWLDEGYEFGRVAVNVAGLQLTRGDLLADIRQALDRSGLAPDRLELEITETRFTGDSAEVRALFRDLRAMGASLAIDDFGTGYSSLSQLRQMPADRLKLDKSFVAALPGQPGDRAVIQAVVAMGDSMRINIIAEGVETAAQRACLLEAGCNFGQGFFFGRPSPADHGSQA